MSQQRTRTLHLTLHRHWFDAIVSGRKKREYRLRSSYWQRRIEGREYDEIQFRNGYAPDAPKARVEWRGLGEGLWEGRPCYVIRLGEILEVVNVR